MPYFIVHNSWSIISLSGTSGYKTDYSIISWSGQLLKQLKKISFLFIKHLYYKGYLYSIYSKRTRNELCFEFFGDWLSLPTTGFIRKDLCFLCVTNPSVFIVSSQLQETTYMVIVNVSHWTAHNSTIWPDLFFKFCHCFFQGSAKIKYKL